MGFPHRKRNAAGDYWGLDTWRDTVYRRLERRARRRPGYLVSRADGVWRRFYPYAYPCLTATVTATPYRPAPPRRRRSARPPPHTRLLRVPTPTSTIGPPCGVLVGNVNTSCSPPATYNYNTSVYVESGCPSSMNGSATLTFLVSETMKGPYTPHDQQTFPVSFNRGHNVFSGALTEPDIPPQYSWYHIDIVIRSTGGKWLWALAANPSVRVPPLAYCPIATPCRRSLRMYPPVTPSIPLCNAWPSGHRRWVSSGGPGEPCDLENRPYFRPNNNVTRGQIAKVVSESAGLSEDPGEQVLRMCRPTLPSTYGSTDYRVSA